MKQNSVQAPNIEDFQHVPSPSALKTKSMEYPSPGTQELSLDKPNYDVFPPVISLESVLSFISTDLSVVGVFFLLVVFSAHLLTVGGHGYTLEDCFNNFGDGEQDMNHLNVKISTGERAFNNHKSGLQSLSRAEICVSTAEDAFNKKGTGEQTLRSAKVGEPHNRAAVKRSFINEGNRKQCYDSRIYRGEIKDKYRM